ncbi:MAG TPA: hypothetical protein VHO70_14855 [Chitinispirillaceae bacterium]|nr:hypothetical protein [Chitinispirillaceae bacterium]
MHSFFNHTIILAALVLVVYDCKHNVFAQSIRRGRNEGTYNIAASNVAGSGNITLESNVKSHYGSDGFGIDPDGSLTVGIADILQFRGLLSLTNFKTIGSAQAHAQITLPSNNSFRFFGAALQGALFLSTQIDTVSSSTTSGKPEFHSYIRPSLVFDIDWMARFKNVPLKSYLWLGAYDNAELLFKYSQLSTRIGIEWRNIRNSFFTDIGLGLYKELKTEVFSGDNRFAQQTLWIEPGVRYRIFNRVSILGALRILIFQRTKPVNGLPPNYIRLSFGIAVPITYKETDTEAIRTMVFIEKQKTQQQDIISKSIDQQKKMRTDFEINFDDLDNKSSENIDEQEAIKRREEISKKMDELEQILETLDE